MPTSYMAYHSDFDFVGDYDHRAQAGMLHVANHHVVPGKKQWTWGCGDFGQAWDRQLTDEDGSYIELMCGAYTDNQPDFSWLQPGEEKRFTQVFMPYKGIGPAKNASKEAVINLQVNDSQATIGVYVTEPRSVQVRLLNQGQQLIAKALQLSPETAFTESLQLPEGTIPQDLTLQVLDDADAENVLVSYTPLPDEKPDVPAPATPARPPQEIESNEELFLNGLHLEQYRHATYPPEPYYEEALRRDPNDSRCNNALGLLLFRRGKFAEAEPCFRKAIERLTLRNPNPYDGEPYYNLGMALKMQGHLEEAVSAFYKATWNVAWQDAGYFELARLAACAARFEEGLELVENALARNSRHHKARHLKIALLRRLAREDAALDESFVSLSLDHMEYGALWERHLLNGDVTFQKLTRGNAHTYVEIALDYAHAGLFEEAVKLLAQTPGSDPMVAYTLGWVYSLQGHKTKAAEALNEASQRSTDYCFPNRLEDVLILGTAMRASPK
ncbi:MAG: DUF5107 domain-containing protein, partial [Deinococcota bacterium]|nr:DUF5107 domain-containing protein [Deinococcota bacterium]